MMILLVFIVNIQEIIYLKLLIKNILIIVEDIIKKMEL